MLYPQINEYNFNSLKLETVTLTLFCAHHKTLLGSVTPTIKIGVCLLNFLICLASKQLATPKKSACFNAIQTSFKPWPYALALTIAQTLTFVPIDREAIDKTLMTADEIKQLHYKNSLGTDLTISLPKSNFNSTTILLQLTNI